MLSAEEYHDSFADELAALRITNDAEDEWAQGFNDCLANVTVLLGKHLMAARGTRSAADALRKILAHEDALSGSSHGQAVISHARAGLTA